MSLWYTFKIQHLKLKFSWCLRSNSFLVNIVRFTQFEVKFIMSSINIIGKSFKRPDGPDKTTGKTKFITDVKIENMVYGHNP